MGQIQVVHPEWPDIKIFCDTPEEAVEFVFLITDTKPRHNRNAVQCNCHNCVKRRKRETYWRGLEANPAGEFREEVRDGR